MKRSWKNFLIGMGSILDLFPSAKPRKTEIKQTAYEAEIKRRKLRGEVMRKDLENVLDDMERALRKTVEK